MNTDRIRQSSLPLLLISCAALVLHFVGDVYAFVGVPLALALLIGWALFFRGRTWGQRGSTTPCETVEEPPLVIQAQLDANEEANDVPLSVLGAEFRREELRSVEAVVDNVVATCTKLIQAHISAHTIAILFPTSDGGYRIRSYISQSEYINQDAVIYPGKGVIGGFLKEGLKQLNLQDIVTDSMTLYYYTKDAGIRSLMATPIVVGGVERGFILADSTEKKHFNDENHAYLSAVAEVCGQAVYYAYLQNEHKLDHVRLVAMSSTEKFFFQKHDIDAVFDKMTELVPFAFPCHRMTLSLREPDSNDAVIKRVWGSEADGFLDLQFSLDNRSLAGIIYSKNLSMYRNFAGDRREIRYTEDEPRSDEFSSFLAYPIGVEECKGLIFLESRQRDAFSHSSRELLSRLVTSAGIAIEKIQILQRTESMATHDGLTGLNNHRQFQLLLKEAITRSIRYNDPLALVICDIDFFKKINDTYGHRFGDTVLREVALRLHSSIRTDIDKSARYGGEEFALILEKTEAASAMETVERIRQLMEKSTFQSPVGKEVVVTMSFGVAIYGLHAKNQEQLIQRADKALYAAKRNGRNRAELYYEVPPVKS